ncbi:unnamed protein product [Somion occarium]|uniref:PH domain-containing protein n=1 Tax=Somion occarium TaxID=3059160 RepID=A0ABP1D044_9APHY
MATFSDGGDATTASASSGDMRFYLQNLLDGKEKQLQQAGTLGQQLLAQRMELEERIRQLQDFDLDAGDDDDATIREKYRELAETIKAWDAENEQLSDAFTLKPAVNGAASPSSHSVELSRGDIERSLERSKASGSGTTAAQSSRRAKNAAHRADDVEFAFEIGSGLLTEVRRLQSLLGERDKALQDVKEEKEDLEKTVESLKTALREQEQSADKFKEENWNLEVTLQELRAQLTDSQTTTVRLEGDTKRLTKMLTTARETADQHKNEAERHQNAFEELKAKHETDVAQARKHAASLQRDKSDLQQSLDSLKVEMAKQSRRFPRFGSPLTPNGASASEAATPADGDDDDVFSTAASTANRKKADTSALFPPDGFDFDSSPDSSPSKPFLAPNHPRNEIEALQQRLAHAQRQINTLKGTLQREKEMRIEYKRKLDSSPALGSPAFDIVEEEEEEDEDFIDEESGMVRPKARLTPFRQGRGRGRGRGRGGSSFARKLDLAVQSPSSEYADDDDIGESSPPPPVPPIPFKYQDEDEDEQPSNEYIQEEEEDTEMQQSPSPPVASNRTSVDGMDPAFANVLRRSTSGSSMTFNRSPLRKVLARSSRGGAIPRRSRGGAAFQEARPPSLVVQPGVLADEFGLGIESSLDNTLELPERETSHFGCQTEPIEEVPEPVIVVDSPPASPPQPAAPAHEVTEIGIQVEPEPVPAVAKAEVSLQTEEEVAPIIVRSDASVQHEDLTPVPVLVSMGIATDPEPKPEPVPEPPAVYVPTFSQAEVQTLVVPSSEADVQTLPEPSPVLPKTTEMQMQTVPELVPVTTHADMQTSTEVHDDQISYMDSSIGEMSGDTTITPRPPPLAMPNFESEDDGTETETGSIMETDTDDYQDARQSMSMVTPTDMDDFHSIMTVTDNEFSSSDDESVKASRLPSREVSAMSSAVSVPLASPTVSEPESPVSPPTPKPTYESRGIETDVAEEPPVVIPIVEEEAKAVPLVSEPPKPELKEMSIQTDEWSPPPPPVPVTPFLPPAPVLVTAPSTPAHSPSPSFRPSQQFQFISPPPSAGPTTTSLPNVPAPLPPSNLSPARDSTVSTFVPRPRTSTSDRRQSIESTLSSAMEDIVARSRTPSNVATVVDKSRPPMMMLPPPPRQPPPPNSMPPPQFIPERRLPTTSNASHDIPPPRPSSPPPPELIQRATTPLGSVLSVPAARQFGLRPHASTVQSSQQPLRQPSSTGSFRSGPSGIVRAPQPSPSIPSFNIRERERRGMSSVSLNSGGQSLDSQRSSLSSDHHGYDQPNQRAHGAPPVTPDRPAGMPGRHAVNSTDPTIIHAITQTMIGEFLYKYTRRAIGKGHGDRRHRRFFWVHPYTRTLYWSSADPGSSAVSESSAKSAYIEDVRSVLDPNPMPPGIHQYSVVVSTPQREMKFTAPTKERHDIWINALQYLLSRPSAGPVASPSNGTALPNSPMSMEARLADDDNNNGSNITDSFNVTPRGQRSQSQLSLGGSMGKRSGTPAAEYLRWSTLDGPNSPTKSFEHIPSNDGELDFELHDETLSDGGFEGLENVRACCDGRHTVGRSGRIEHHHHHSHPHDHPREPSRTRDQHLDPNPQEISRPVSPAWSFRSRAGSATSHDRDGTGFFSRFGSRRSTKTAMSSSTTH